MKKLVFALLICVVLLASASSDYISQPLCEPELIDAIAFAESSYRDNAVSSSGAMGMYQFMPIAIEDLKERFAYEFNPFNASEATTAAHIYMHWLLQHFDLPFAVIAWNYGYGNTMKYIAGETNLPTSTVIFLWNVASKYGENKEVK